MGTLLPDPFEFSRLSRAQALIHSPCLISLCFPNNTPTKSTREPNMSVLYGWYPRTTLSDRWVNRIVRTILRGRPSLAHDYTRRFPTRRRANIKDLYPAFPSTSIFLSTFMYSFTFSLPRAIVVQLEYFPYCWFLHFLDCLDAPPAPLRSVKMIYALGQVKTNGRR